jgi:hypothetical protein
MPSLRQQVTDPQAGCTEGGCIEDHCAGGKGDQWRRNVSRKKRERGKGGCIRFLVKCVSFRWNFTVADMDLSVIEGMEGSEFNCGVSPALAKLRFQVDTLRGVLFAIDRYTQYAELAYILCYDKLTIDCPILYIHCAAVWILVVAVRSCGKGR